MLSARTIGSGFNLHNNFYKKLSVILLILVLAIITFVTVSYLTAPSNNLSNPQPISETTSLFPTNHVVYVNDNSTTGVIVEISGSSLPDDAYFTITTANYGTNVPKDAGAPLTVEGAIAAGYYDVKVTTNITLSLDIIAKLTITNLNFNEHSTMYYYNTTQGKWVSVSTEFQPSHVIIGTLAAIALTGTPIGGTDNPLLGPLFVASEYCIGVGTLLALFACFAAFAFFKIRGKHTDKTAPTLHISKPKPLKPRCHSNYR
jgi:hypothetical protein